MQFNHDNQVQYYQSLLEEKEKQNNTDDNLQGLYTAADDENKEENSKAIDDLEKQVKDEKEKNEAQAFQHENQIKYY